MALASTGVKCWTACPRGLGLLVHLRRPAQTWQSANLPDPDVLTLEKAEELEVTLEQFATIAEHLKP